MTDRRKTTRIDVIGQNGNDGEHYNPRAAAFVQRQTARRLLEGVARELDRTGVRLTKAGDRLNGDYLHVQAEQVRDALALLVGD